MNRPKVGVGVLVAQNQNLLLGKRINSPGADTWCPPGGHLEFGETPEQCAKRELEEEAGIKANDIVAGPWSNDFFKTENKHYITIYTVVRSFSGVPKIMEPDKCSTWEWFPFDRLPEPLFLSLHNLLKKTSLLRLFEAIRAKHG